LQALIHHANLARDAGLAGYLSTAAKHGTSIFTTRRDALAGNPWMPPIPGLA
jgi:hypothetical protein